MWNGSMDVQWNEYNWEPTNACRNHCPPSFSHPAMKEKNGSSVCCLHTRSVQLQSVGWWRKSIQMQMKTKRSFTWTIKFVLWRRKTCSIRHHPQGECHKPVEQSWTIIIHVVLNQHLKWEHLEAFSNKANNKGNHCSIETEFCKEKIHHSGSAGIYNPYFSSKAPFQLSHFQGVGGKETGKETVQMVRKLSGQSKNCPDNLETVQIIQKLSGQSKNCPDNLQLSGKSRNFPDNPKTVETIYKLSR